MWSLASAKTFNCIAAVVSSRLSSTESPAPPATSISLGVVPNVSSVLIEIGGKGSALHQKHKVYLDAVTVATPPENYEERLVPMFPGAWRRLRLFALEAHDLALSKLERNIERDRDDVQQLARAGHLRADILRERNYAELRPNLLAHEARHDLTLRLWLESYWPV
jgi:hypothetical protein